ncbi:hypothetical protein GCM10017635_28040 [Paracoccus kondratievae]|uniref:Uncharacterized protein n=2 Tax=Paracoccus kondratievae TaxID=135740 RepID=A0AAD3P1R9_9RHOB|nr:hypothetical protein GCM10017635_28040 [Paracoccus kondratievae]
MADERAPGQTEIALDVELTSGKAEVRVDDVPFFGPGQALDAEASIVASLPANSILGPGLNDVLLHFTPTDSGLGNEPVFRARFGYAPAGTFPDAFSDRPFAILVDIRPDPQQPGGFKLEQAIQGQPLLTGKLNAPTLTTLPDGALEVSLQLDVGVDLPTQKWKGGRQLSDDATTRRQVESMMRRAHSALAAGPATIKQELGPMLQRLAATVGMTVDEAIVTEYAPYVDKSMGFELQPFDASQSRLVIMGNGRLATLIPPPVVFHNAEIGESGGPMLIYWQDANGEWQIIH